MEAQANAAFIVKACNSHDSLLDALEAVVNESDRITPDYKDYLIQTLVMDKARVALAKARGE